MLHQELKSVRLGLLFSMLTLIFGIGMGVAFSTNEDAFKGYVKAGVAANPQVHDAKSNKKIWRYAQRAHFHAAGIGAFTLGLVVLTGLTGMAARMKTMTAALIGLGGLYPFSWLSMFFKAPEIGREAAHHAMLTELWVYGGVGCLLVGLILLFSHLFFGTGSQQEKTVGDAKPVLNG